MIGYRFKYIERHEEASGAGKGGVYSPGCGDGFTAAYIRPDLDGTPSMCPVSHAPLSKTGNE